MHFHEVCHPISHHEGSGTFWSFPTSSSFLSSSLSCYLSSLSSYSSSLSSYNLHLVKWCWILSITYHSLSSYRRRMPNLFFSFAPHRSLSSLSSGLLQILTEAFGEMVMGVMETLSYDHLLSSFKTQSLWLAWSEDLYPIWLLHRRYLDDL